MLTTILAWTAIGFAHLIIGVSIVKLNLKIWKKEKRNWLSFILFPINTVFNKVGKGTGPTPIAEITDSMEENIYKKIAALFWPIKLALNLITMTIIGAFYSLYLSVKFAGHIIDLIEKPGTVLSDWSAKRLEKKLEKAKQFKLLSSDVDPMLDGYGYTRADIETQMEEQRRIVDAATSQAEGAKKEYEKLKKIHETTWSRG